MKKLNVAIIDDNRSALELLKSICDCIDKIENVKAYLNPLDFLKEIGQGKKYDLYLFDIEMPVLSGDKLVDVTRELYPDAVIVFVSGYSKQGSISFLKDIYCLSKPVEYDELQLVLKKLEEDGAFQTNNKNIELCNLHSNGESLYKYNIDRQDILLLSSYDIIKEKEDKMFCSNKNSIYLYIKGSDSFFELKNSSVKRFEEDHNLLFDSKRFFKVNKSTIINKESLFLLSKRDEVQLKLEGKICCVSLSEDRLKPFNEWMRFR